MARHQEYRGSSARIGARNALRVVSSRSLHVGHSRSALVTGGLNVFSGTCSMEESEISDCIVDGPVAKGGLVFAASVCLLWDTNSQVPEPACPTRAEASRPRRAPAHAAGSARASWATPSLLQYPRPNHLRGGNLVSFPSQGIVRIGSHSLLQRGRTLGAQAQGSLLFLETSGSSYVLPAPLGRWAPGITCTQIFNPCPAENPGCDVVAQGLAPLQQCDWATQPELLGKVVFSLPVGPMNEYAELPFRCPSGVYGEAEQSGSQDSSLCSGLCPPGHALPSPKHP